MGSDHAGARAGPLELRAQECVSFLWLLQQITTNLVA